MSDKPDTILPSGFARQVIAAAELCKFSARIVFRDKEGVEHPVAKVKIRGFDTIIICEDLNG